MVICIKMLLQPRSFIFKKIHKHRTRVEAKSASLKFGTSGLLLLQPTRLSSRHLAKFKLFLKRAMRKSDKTKRFVWLNSFPYLPLTRKSVGSRMGKGKGKVEIWFSQLKPGLFLFEFFNLRHGRAMFFFKQMARRLQILTKPFFSNKTYLPCPSSNSKKFFFSIFW